MPLPLKLLLLLLVITAGLYDWRYRRIPNWLNVSGALVGIILNVLLAGRAGAAASVLGLLCALAIYIPLYMLRGMGAGDVKLMMAVGVIAGPSNWLKIFIATALLGGVAALIVALVNRKLRETCGNTGTILMALSHGSLPFEANPQLDVGSSKALRMPHGTVIAGGVFIFLLLPLFPH